ncbi:MAG: GTPase Era [Acidimicrobiia bacterium]|nr:GTPase Era [Acidimicrobiia bacterium]
MRSGFVAVVGRPNVGKSTLVNAMVGRKVAITSSRPQTTRSAIRGVLTDTEERWQMVLVDTPGIHKPRTELGSRLNGIVSGTLKECDVVLMVIDATAPIGSGDQLTAERVRVADRPTVLVVNKVDASDPGRIADQLAVSSEWDFDSYVPISAQTGEGVPIVVSEIAARLQDGPMYFPEEMWTDQPEAMLIAELIREKFLERLRDELPHSLAMRIEDLETRDDGLFTITADVVVERKSQKGIVIGKGASLLKVAGTEAREELERLFGTKVHLDLRVVVERDWQRRATALDRLGFE